MPPPPKVVLEGTVRDLAGQMVLPGLMLRLIPPKYARSPERVVRTDERGYFRFTDPKNPYQGRYLLEIDQGADLL